MKIFEGELQNPAISVSSQMIFKTPCFESGNFQGELRNKAIPFINQRIVKPFCFE